MNMLTHEYLYNGGGVGIGDFNNDKLPDIYFASNLGSNKMYLNRGQFSFEDITEAAGVTGEKRWSRGVSVVDINNDGLSDIYVCATTWQTPDQRRNLLYINQGVDPATGIPHFVEMAKGYGLDDTASTHMAAFFDYDNDGDLDVYLLVNRLSQELPNTFRPVKTDGSALNTDKLYRNDCNPVTQQPFFTNVSKEAGITWEGFGLGVNILDINKDGWKDVWVSNDYLSGDLLYINNRNGTFTNRIQDYIRHGSLNAMGNDAGDLNNDGWVDLIETDMAAEDNYRSKMMMNPVDVNWYGYSAQYKIPYQVVRNTLQANRGPRNSTGDSTAAPVFSEIGLQSGIAYTDWSWAPLLLDADQDGLKDLMVTNGLPKDITDLDFISYRDQNSATPVTDLLLKLPAVQLSNYVFRNEGEFQFTDHTQEWGFDFPTFSTGIAYADFDADGDMDVVINNTNLPATLLENTINENKETPHHFLKIQFRGDTSNINGIGSVADLYYSGKHQTAELTPYRGYASSVENILHFGLGETTTIDSVVITWPSGRQDVMTQVPADQTLLMSQSVSSRMATAGGTGIAGPAWFRDVTNAAGILYVNPPLQSVDFNLQKAIPHQFAQYGAAMATGDLNKDGRTDLVVGGNPGQPRFIYFQEPDGRFTAKILNNTDLTQSTLDAGLALFDAEGDGDEDIYVTTGGFAAKAVDPSYRDYLLLNDGKGFFTPAPNGSIPAIYASKSCVRPADADGDGDIDLFIGGRVVPGNYPAPENSYLLINESSGTQVKFTDQTATLAPQLENLGMVSDAVWADLDKDGRPELVVTGEWMGIRLYHWNSGKLEEVKTDMANSTGWWNSLSATDLDSDGDMDLLAGNYGTNGYFHAKSGQPLSVYTGDYDGNGQPDLFMSQYRAERPHGVWKPFPALLRDQVAEGLPLIKKQYNNYKSFAEASTDDVLSKLNRSSELQYTVTELRSGWWENQGKNTFVFHPFPAVAQWAPVFGMLVNDYNEDGHLDIILNGNDYSQAPVPGRLDALTGLLLQGDGKGGFLPLSPASSGVFIPGNGKGLVELQVGNRIRFFAAQQGGPLLLFESSKTEGEWVNFPPAASYAELMLSTGKVRRVENRPHTSFYSQCKPAIRKSNSVKEIRFYSAEGKRLP